LDKSEIWWLVIFCKSILVSCIACIIVLNSKLPSNAPLGVTMEMVGFCDKPLINDTGQCLTNYVSDFFKYTERVDSEDVTFEMLYQEGGDCQQWSKFYKEAGEQLGKDVQIVTLHVGIGDSHQMAIMSDKTGYCLFDGKYSACGLYGDD
jgi:hypothetical protein